MKFYIPKLKDRLRLTEDWVAMLHDEYRNHAFIASVLGVKKGTPKNNSYEYMTNADGYQVFDYSKITQIGWDGLLQEKLKEYESNVTKMMEAKLLNNRLYQGDLELPVTIPKGTVLCIQRIYIRNGQQDYDSVTFSIAKVKGSKISGRFWVKLDNANEIHYELVTEG